MAAYNKKTIEDIDVAGKTVLVRCDFNVPMKDGVITSDKRIVGALPTIEYLMNKGAKLRFRVRCTSASDYFRSISALGGVSTSSSLIQSSTGTTSNSVSVLRMTTFSKPELMTRRRHMEQDVASESSSPV